MSVIRTPQLHRLLHLHFYMNEASGVSEVPYKEKHTFRIRYMKSSLINEVSLVVCSVGIL